MFSDDYCSPYAITTELDKQIAELKNNYNELNKSYGQKIKELDECNKKLEEIKKQIKVDYPSNDLTVTVVKYSFDINELYKVMKRQNEFMHHHYMEYGKQGDYEILDKADDILERLSKIATLTLVDANNKE